MNENPETTKAGYVAIIGKPNAGKSTLMNSLVGAKLSIITPKPQTTRKSVLGIYSNDTEQIVFLDTPGLIKPKYEMHSSMMRYVNEALGEADVVIVIADTPKIGAEGDYFPPKFWDMMKKVDKPKILVLNKVDLFENKRDILPLIARFSALGSFDEVVPLSALKSDNTEVLLNLLLKYMPEGPFFYDPELLSTQPERFFVSEMIREHVFTMFEDEVPYSTEVNIVQFKERENGKWYISADIIVERDTQKGIIIGTGGSKLKELGTKARADIEEHLGLPVFLEIFVKVRQNWRSNRNMLKSFGY